jgi:hypothetical protein
MEENKPQEQLKKFPFFVPEQVVEQIADPKSHPIRLSDLRVTDIVQVKSKYNPSHVGFSSWKTKRIASLSSANLWKQNGFRIHKPRGN